MDSDITLCNTKYNVQKFLPSKLKRNTLDLYACAFKLEKFTLYVKKNLHTLLDVETDSHVI